MSAVSDRTANIKTPQTREVILGFSPESVKAPFLLRCGALIIDYIIVIGIPVIGLLVSRFSGNDGAKLLNDGFNNAGWFVAILVAVCNIILLPMYSGQTLGKIATRLRIVKLDGTAPTVGAVAFRQTVGYFLTLVTLGLGFLLACFGARGRALHDYLSGTVVIYANRTVQRD